MLDWIDAALSAREADGLRRRRIVVAPLPGGRCRIGGRTFWNFAGNDYLGLAFDPRLADAADRAAREYGHGATASPLVSGRTPVHDRLEAALAAWYGREAALLFPTGYAANLGTVAALVGPGDTVFCDRLNHACLVDGGRLSGARLRVFRHSQLDRLESELTRSSGRKLIVTDGVFSMEGCLAPLDALCEIAERHGAMLAVDEAHGVGLLGENGRGAAERLGVLDRVPILIGTLSKAFAALGGFVVGARRLIDWLGQNARTQVYSTALPPGVCAAAHAALDVVRAEPWRRGRVEGLAGAIRAARAAWEASGRCQRLPVAGHAVEEGAIVPVLLGEPGRVMAAAAGLEARGFLVGAIRPPTVPRGTSRLRITVTAAHTPEAIAELGAALEAVLAVPHADPAHEPEA